MPPAPPAQAEPAEGAPPPSAHRRRRMAPRSPPAAHHPLVGLPRHHVRHLPLAMWLCPCGAARPMRVDPGHRRTRMQGGLQGHARRHGAGVHRQARPPRRWARAGGGRLGAPPPPSVPACPATRAPALAACAACSGTTPPYPPSPPQAGRARREAQAPANADCRRSPAHRHKVNCTRPPLPPLPDETPNRSTPTDDARLPIRRPRAPQ